MRRRPFRRWIGSAAFAGRAERHGFEYYRHRTLSLYAALDTATGHVHGKTAARHTSRDFSRLSEGRRGETSKDSVPIVSKGCSFRDKGGEIYLLGIISMFYGWEFSGAATGRPNHEGGM
jgi:hypothetical protein